VQEDYALDDDAAKAGAKQPNVRRELKRELIVKSLKKAKGYHQGQEVDCRLLEISMQTGELSGGAIKPGPAAKRVYKVLVPESKIIGKPRDSEGIFVSMLPVATDKTGKTVMGLKKIGTGAEVPLTAPVLQVYPMLTLLQHYRSLNAMPAQGAIEIAGKQITQYTRYKATRVIESPSSRSTNEATLVVTDQVPTGLAKWDVTLTREEKNSAQSWDERKLVTKITTSLTARTISFNDAQSELGALP